MAIIFLESTNRFNTLSRIIKDELIKIKLQKMEKLYRKNKDIAIINGSNKTIVIITGLLHKAEIENFLQKKEMVDLCKLITLESALSNPPVPDF